MIVMFGAATIWYHDEKFINWMPSVILWVAYSFSTDEWANYHTFGSTELSNSFIVGRSINMNNHQQTEEIDRPAR